MTSSETGLHSEEGKVGFEMVRAAFRNGHGRLSFQFSATSDWNELQKSLKLETHISLSRLKHLGLLSCWKVNFFPSLRS